ncbi:MAG: twin-arginine translocation signal domain-containing protein [Pseudomonadota bacterium]
MFQKSIDRRQFISTALAGAAAAVVSPAVAATDFMVGKTPVIALSDGHFNMPSDMFLGTPQSLRDKLGNPAQIAANT